MNQTAIRHRAGPAERLALQVLRVLAAGLYRLRDLCLSIGWRIARQRTRRALAQLDDRMLADVGITREQALREAGKLPWPD